MASTTAEVALYFGEDDPDFLEAVDRLRFTANPSLGFEEIRKILGPVWSAAYDKGYRDAAEEVY
jgi:hypothetical protein